MINHYHPVSWCGLALLILSGSCLDDVSLQSCEQDEHCPARMICRGGACFHFVPPWEIPPCSSPAAKGPCCDLEPAVISASDPDCRRELLSEPDTLSPAARTRSGEIVVSTRQGDEALVISISPDGSEVWRETVDMQTPVGPPPRVRIAGDDAVYVGGVDRVWTRSATGLISALPAGGTIDGGFAVCAEGVAVAMVRGADHRGLVRLDDDPSRWPLSFPLASTPALPPAISRPDDVAVVAWSDGTLTVHDLSSGEASTPWSNPDTLEGITGLALDGSGHAWITTGAGTMLRLLIPDDPMAGDLDAGYLRVVLGTVVHTPPVIPAEGLAARGLGKWGAVIGLGDGRVVRGDDLNNPIPIELSTLETRAPGTLALLEGEGLMITGECPSGRCLSIAFLDPGSFFGASYDSKGEHRHSGLPADAAVSLPGPEGLATLVSGDRLDGLVVVGPPREAPWPGPNGGPGNGRCAEGAR